MKLQTILIGKPEFETLIEYELIRRKGKKNITLRVLSPDGSIRVTASPNTPKREIDRFVLSKAAWIEKRQRQIADSPKREPSDFADGEQISIWGKPVTLRILMEGKRTRAVLDGETLALYTAPEATTQQMEQAFENCMKRELTCAINSMLPRIESMTGLHCNGYQIRKMSSRWGSCTIKTGKMRFALKLYSYPSECLEMVIVHELGHLLHPDHGQGFKSYMDHYCPDWRNIRKLLS